MVNPDRPRILVVDDDEAGRYAVGRVLRRAEFDVWEAGTGEQALRTVAEHRPDLVLLDMRLPDIPGVEVCRRIKSSPGTASTLVLQMSASMVDASSRVAALDGGADGYVTAPLDPAVLVATVRSLMRIRAAEQALQDAAIEWQTTFDAIGDGVALLDRQGVVKRANTALPALLGNDRADIAGRSLDEVIPPAAGDPPLVTVLESMRRTTMERVLGERTLSVAVDPLAADGLRGGVAIVTDITQRNLLEQQLRQAQKLESIGLLAGGVAHDFNNLLMGILGNASLALGSLEDADQTQRLLKDVVSASERAAELTKQLLAYAGKGRFVTAPVDLSRMIHDLRPLMQASIPRNVRLTLDLGRGLPAVDADQAQIKQLVMNLIVNAGEAMQGESGTVIVATAARRVGPEELGSFLTGHHDAGDYVVLRIRDTGIGMDEETRKRIFDPFFSTKFLGRGLGLSASLGIVRGHHGAMNVSSAPAQGTEFEVLFPALVDRPAPSEARKEETLAAGPGTILVVDDQEVVRNFVEQALTRAGYDVLLAVNGLDAVDVFSRNANRISLVLLDLVMPVMSGEQALSRILDVNPGVPVVVSSGQDESECMRRLGDPRVAGFLQKPYTSASLMSKVQSVLGTAVSGAAGGAEKP